VCLISESWIHFVEVEELIDGDEVDVLMDEKEAWRRGYSTGSAVSEMSLARGCPSAFSTVGDNEVSDTSIFRNTKISKKIKKKRTHRLPRLYN
jgi:hypothetical protein